MTPPEERHYRAGEPVPDLCRACKALRGHTVIAGDEGGRPLRVMCDFCGSQHDYRGGEPRAGALGPHAQGGGAAGAFTCCRSPSC